MRPKSFILYRNQQYGFGLKIPSWWRNHTFLDESNRTDEHVEASINFILRYTKEIRGKKETLIFSIVIFNMTEEDWQEQYGDSVYRLLGYKNGRVYTYITPLEPPEEFLKKDLSDYDRNKLEFKWLVHMINKDVPRIVQSFYFTVDNAK